jgi:hippurate hydrolase
LFSRLVTLRRDIHAHPELSFEEHRTGTTVAEAVRQFGLRPTLGVVRTGLVVDIGDAPGPRVVLRADLDALPIDERTAVPWKSTTPGKMHACGHDAHTAMLLGAGVLLAASPPEVPVRLLFQPAEEKGNGALHVVREGWMDGARWVFGVHVDPFHDVGQIIVQPGPMNAASLSFSIRIQGRGGHGGKPHEGVDAVVVAAHTVLALQHISSREVHPGQPVVVTVGRMVAGTRHNVMAGEAELDGTIRTFDSAVTEQIREAISRIAGSVAAGHRARAELSWGEGCPPVVNDEAAARLAEECVRETFGPEAVARMPMPNMGAEDFSFLQQKAAGAYVRIGARPPGTDPEPTHSAGFDLDERCIAVGARYLEAVARRAARR